MLQFIGIMVGMTCMIIGGWVLLSLLAMWEFGEEVEETELGELINDLQRAIREMRTFKKKFKRGKNIEKDI